jgi:adenylate kinase
MAKIEESEDELVNEIKAKIEELKDAMVAQIEESRPEDAEPEEIDREKLQVRLPDEILFKLLKIRLTENDCRNRGYILDGYPRTYKHAREIFLYKPKKIVDGEEVEEDEPELEEGEEKSYEGYVSNPDIFPKSVIVLQGDDEFLINRVK